MKLYLPRTTTKHLTKLQQLGNGFIFTDDKQPIYINDIKLRYVKKILKETTEPVLVIYSFVPDKERLLEIPGASLIEFRR